MPKSVNQKQKLLFLLDYLRQNTDETHTVTTPQIIDHLAANGIRAERKSIYNDIQTLCDYGYDIIRTEGAHAGYREMVDDLWGSDGMGFIRVLTQIIQKE
jgi:predicted DNA-binding transcriptional regulator YafY